MIKKIATAFSLIVILLVFYQVGSYFFGILSFFGPFDKYYSKADLIENYEANKIKISELQHYFKSICPKGKFVEIEFEDGDIGRINIGELNGKSRVSSPYYQDWNIEIGTKKADSIFNSLNWDEGKVNLLKEKIENANCISISNLEPCEIGFKRSGLGMYSFLKYKKPMNDSIMKEYKKSCSYIIYNRNVIFEYGGGAIDSDCFPENR